MMGVIKQEIGEYEDSSDEDDRLMIDDAGGRTLTRSLSLDGQAKVPGILNRKRKMSSENNNASDAIESLLLLGQQAVVGPPREWKCEPHRDGIYERYTDPRGKKIKVSYLQNMRERNNEASKRCRLKRRIKEESFEKAKVFLESHREALGHRIAKLHKFKNILNKACLFLKETSDDCQCMKFVAEIKKSNREMPDLMSLSNAALIAKSKIARHTNILEFLFDEATMTDMAPQKRGPRRFADTNVPIISTMPSGKILVPIAPQPSKGVPIQIEPGMITINSNNHQLLRTITRSVPGEKTIFLSASNSNLETIPSFAKLTLPPTTTIIARPLDMTLTMDNNKNRATNNQDDIITKPLDMSRPRLSEDIIEKVEPEVIIKQEPDIDLIAPENIVYQNIKNEQPDGVDPILTCIAINSSNLSCTQDLQDLNSLSQILDLVSMRPSSATGTSAAEKAIIKSRLGIEFWKAEESPRFICTAHRQEITQNNNMQSCSICGKKWPKKGVAQQHMSIITYRMALEFYMTRGNFLPIGHLACANCKVKTLKGLDFSDSITVSLDEKERTITAISEIQLKEIKNEVDLVYVYPDFYNSDEKAIQESHNILPKKENNIFDNIQRLNDALAAVNPNYQPLGYSITSLESCTDSVLQDTIDRTQTAISTILTAIAPGQEETLWKTVRPGLDRNYGRQQQSAQNIITSHSN